MHTENHHFMLSKALHDKMTKIYIFQALLTFVKAMIGIFVPVYLFKLGFSVIEVILYSIGHSLIYLLLIPLSTKTIKKIGFKYTILLTVPMYLIHIISLNFLTAHPIFFHIAWITIGIYISFFWPAMHSEIALNGSKKHRGSQMGTLQIISTIFAAAAPLIGGIFLENIGYFQLMILMSVIILIGLIPLLYSEDIKVKKYEFHFKDYIRLYKNKKLTNSKIAFASEGVASTLNMYLWPIVVFILLEKNFLSFGILATAISVISILFVLYMKNYIDKHPKEKVLNFTSKVLSLNWIVKGFIFLLGSFALYFLDLITKLLFNLFSLSFLSIFYNNAQKVGYMDYIVLREEYLHTTKIITGFLIIGYLSLVGTTLMTLSLALLVGVVFSWGLAFLKEEN